jgi:hypothetical protein
VTEVTRIPAKPLLLFVLALALFAAPLGRGQSPADTADPSPTTQTGTVVPPGRSAETLYMQLRSVGLDKSRVYAIRDATLNRPGFQITFDDGTIAFTEDVAGRVTGAFFEGEGEVLLVPRDQAERASMMLFTGAAILEERFVTGYLRFNDETFGELQPALRPAGDPAQFVSEWNEMARHLAQVDSLRLLLSFSKLLPSPVEGPPADEKSKGIGEDDRMLHARLQGRNLSAFDLCFDSLAAEQVWAGQLKTAGGESYYDMWASFSPVPGQAKAGDATGTMGEEAKGEEIEVSQYRVLAQVEPPTKLNVDAALQLEVRQGGQRAVLFELSRFLSIQSVQADGHPVEFIHNTALEGTQIARRGNDLVAIIFPRSLRAGEKIELDFVYGGEVLSEAGAGLLYVGARGTWYPNRGLEMSKFDLRFRYPEGWTLVATGKRVEDKPQHLPPGDQESHWVSERPMPVAGFNMGKYSRVAARAGDVQVEAYATPGVERSFPRAPEEEETRQPVLPFPTRRMPAPVPVVTLPPSPARNAQAVAASSARAVEFLARRFGPYPYSSLALTQMPGDLSQGWPSLIFLSSFSFLTAEEKSQLRLSSVARSLSNSVIAHETAHQWWGDLVSWSSYRDQWLFEALANYSSLVLLESDSPAQFHEVMEKYRQDLLAKNKDGLPLADAGPVTLGLRLTSSHFPSGYETVSYGRGAWLFHMLRCMMRDADRKNSGRSWQGSDAGSDESFWRALRTIRERYQEKSLTTQDLLHGFEEELPRSLWFEGQKSLDWFYRGWVNGTALPRLELQEVKYGGKPGAFFVTGTIAQTDGPQDLVTVVPVYAVLSGKNILLGQVFADGPETSFRLPVPPGARKVVLDPYQTVLTRGR